MKFTQKYISKMYIRPSSSSCGGTVINGKKYGDGFPSYCFHGCLLIYIFSTHVLKKHSLKDLLRNFEWWLS